MKDIKKGDSVTIRTIIPNFTTGGLYPVHEVDDYLVSLKDNQGSYRWINMWHLQDVVSKEESKGEETIAVPIIVAGGRNFNDWELLNRSLNAILLPEHEDEYEIISGGATGADSLAVRWAEGRGYKSTVVNADWKKHGRAAGPIRNAEMAKLGKILIAFWDGQSRGTANMIGQARKHGINTVFVIYYSI